VSISLNRELDNSSTFIYEGIKKIYETQYLNDVGGNVFNFLYNLSVGFERIQKIILYLLEIKEKNDFHIPFNQKYQIHNHIGLHQFMKEKIEIDLNENQTGLLAILADFYKNNRYGRFDFCDKPFFELEGLIRYLSKTMKKSPEMVGEMSYENSLEMKDFLSKQIIKLFQKYHNIINGLSSELNIFVDESCTESRVLDLIYGSYNIHNDNLNFYQRHILLSKEFILMLIKLDSKKAYLNDFNHIESLDIEDYLEEYGINDLISENIYSKNLDIFEELAYIAYDKQKIDVKKRKLDFFMIPDQYYWNT